MKDSSGLIFRRCFDRLAEDSCRRAAILREIKHCDLPDNRSTKGRLTSLISIVEGDVNIKMYFYF
jgi:hypothetical protein